MPTWSNTTNTTISWQQLSGVTEGRGTGIAPGYDFRLTVNNQHPWKVNDSRPVYLADDVGENP